MIQKYFDGVVPAPSEYTERDLVVQKKVADATAAADAAIESFRIDEAIDAIWTIVDDLNLYITENEPWALAKQFDGGDEEQGARLRTVLYTCAEGLRALAVLLSPVMPQSTAKLWDALGVEDSLGEITAQPIREAGTWGALQPGTTVSTLAPLFPRVEQTA
jgi:methionyl-tRNA synthetase